MFLRLRLLLENLALRDLEVADQELRRRWVLATAIFCIVNRDPGLAVPLTAAALAFRGGRGG